VRVFTLGLVIFLVGFWPQLAWGFLLNGPPRPPEPKFFWAGRLASPPKADCCREEGNSEGNYLILVAVTGAANFPATDNKVALLVGNEVKAETVTSDGLAVFSLKGNLLDQNLTLKVSAHEPDLTELLGPDGSFVAPDGSFAPWFLEKIFVPPEKVEIVVLSQPKSKAIELPGFPGKSFSTAKECPVHNHLVLDLALQEKDRVENLMSWTPPLVKKREYATREFSLKDNPDKRDIPSLPNTAKARWLSNNSPVRSAPTVKLLNENQLPVAGSVEIQPVDCRKGTADDSLTPGIFDECRFLLPLKGQEAEVIVIHKYQEPSPPKPSLGDMVKQFLFSCWNGSPQ
jgi:hypothetical protein